MKYLSLMLVVMFTLVFFMNIGMVFHYQVNEVPDEVSQTVRGNENFEIHDEGGMYGGLNSIKDYKITGNLDSNEISFNTPTETDIINTSQNPGEDKKVFFFGKPVVETETPNLDWDSDWTVDDNYDFTPLPTVQEQNNQYSEPLEVTFDRFLNGE